jgi:opacity protein-like surface antigen
MRRLLPAALAAVSSFAMPAFGADLPVKAKVPLATVYDWTGFYAGVHAGYGGGMSDWGGINIVTKGAFGGAQVGANQQVGNYVFGVELDASAPGPRGTTFETIAVPFSVSTFNASITSKFQDFGTVAGRFGFAADRLLVYGKVGFAWAYQEHSQWQQSVITGVNGQQLVNISGRELHRGPMLGLGAEYAFMNNWSVKAEYNLLDFSDPKRVDETGTLTSFAGTTSNLKAVVPGVVERIHLAKIGLNYHFGQRRAEIAPSIPRTSYNWSGFYVGLEGAGAWSDMGFVGFQPWGDYGIKGWLAGGVAGARTQITPVAVAGVEAEFMGGRVNGGRTDITSTTVSGVTTQTLATNIDWLATATAHFGFLPTERWFVYGKGGVAIAHANHTNNLAFNGVPGVTSSFFFNNGDALHTGGLAGVGTEYAFFGNWSAKLEYNFIRFQKQAVFLPGTITEISPVLGTGTTSLPNSATLRATDMHLVKFGINYRFPPELFIR